jgi:hypothetical protein
MAKSLFIPGINAIISNIDKFSIYYMYTKINLKYNIYNLKY